MIFLEVGGCNSFLGWMGWKRNPSFPNKILMVHPLPFVDANDVKSACVNHFEMLVIDNFYW